MHEILTALRGENVELCRKCTNVSEILHLIEAEYKKKKKKKKSNERASK